MQLKDIADMETYLTERCYCPGEIYDISRGNSTMKMVQL